MAIRIEISEDLADDLREWAKDEQEHWPSGTLYQEELGKLLKQLDQSLMGEAP